MSTQTNEDSPKGQATDNNPMNAAERRTTGKRLRKQVPRSSHGDWVAASDRPDPIGLLQQQDEGRLQHLLPIKYGRMMASPFAFLRGSAAVMAADLAASPVTGLEVVLCGDAHLSNFGLFATPERESAFDINDFDEAYPGPWELDLKRLAASAVVAGRDNGFSDKTCAENRQWSLPAPTARRCEVWPPLPTWMCGITASMQTFSSSIFDVTCP